MSAMTVAGVLALLSAAFAAETPADPLHASGWRLVNASGLEPDVLDRAPGRVTARFSNGRVSGSSGCNQYSGTYEAEGDRLTLGPLAGTMMACPEPAMILEGAFKRAFAGTVRFVRTADRMTLTTEVGATLVFRAEPPPVLEGVSWEVTGFNNGREAVVSPLPGTTLTLAFREGTLTGHAGCNSYRATYTRDGNRLTIGPAAATRKACPQEGIMAQEQQFLAALATATRWTVQGDELDLHRADGARAMAARRTSTP